MIFIKENFISNELCNEIIDIYQLHYSEQNFEYGGTFPYWIYHQEYKTHHNLIKNIVNIVTNLCNLFDASSKLETCQIVKWPESSSQQKHIDPPGDIFAALIYLNDNYDGGETCFEGVTIKPEVGKLVIFSSRELLHWVSQVKNSDRYTLALWFTK